MLTRLKVTGFKNLVDVDVHFGPFTCIAGENAVGKSNLFDAILFLSTLADMSLMEAATKVRDEAGGSTDIRSLFHRVGERWDDRMTFETEMIVPPHGEDDLGQPAEASITFLSYRLVLGFRDDDGLNASGPLFIHEERLERIKLGDWSQRLHFHSNPAWRSSVLTGRRQTPLISTNMIKHQIDLHQDGGGGRLRPYAASGSRRTVLSTINTAEHPTALLARREMQSWQLLQLEPHALRAPDKFTSPQRLGADGSHLAATLARLARIAKGNGSGVTNGRQDLSDPEMVYSRIANRLADLLDDVRYVTVDRDERRELFEIRVTGRDRTSHPARSLSDGTLRFLALAVLEQDPDAKGVLCLEEPENGIHPGRIQAMLDLLNHLAVDTFVPVGPGNPLRQVIINTHSPAVVKQVDDDDLLVGEFRNELGRSGAYKAATFRWLPDTWRARAFPNVHCVSRGKLLAYLSDSLPALDTSQQDSVSGDTGRPHRRVIDRPDIRQFLLPGLKDT